MGFSSVANKAEIEKNYTTLITTIKETFGPTSERTQRLLELYSDYEERVKSAPASGKINFHNAYEGGYLAHILNVLDCARLMKKLYSHKGGWVDFTDEELVFVALHHDLGKLGTLEEPYYVVQDSEWHRKNRLEAFKINDNRQYMRVGDLSAFILQQYGVATTQIEFLSIRLTDGLYDEANKPYLIQYGSGPFPMRMNLPYIMHWSDSMAVRIESDPERKKLTH